MSQQQNDELTKILLNALSPDQGLIKSAEVRLNQMASENIGYFLLELSIKLSSEGVKKEIRQISATIIKNMVRDNKHKSQWETLDNELKQKIKQYVLSTLASQDNDIRKSAGLAIAGICHVDLPNKQWLDIFGVLVDTSQNENLAIQIASVTTLGFIFEEISLGNIQQSDIAKILNAFFTILNNDVANILLVEYTLIAILNFTQFISDIIGVQEQKIILFDLIKKFIMHSSNKIRLIAIKIFIEFIKCYYDKFIDYIDTVIDFSVVIMDKDVEENAIVCYEIWGLIGMIEVNRLTKMKGSAQSLNYCQKASQKLLPIMLGHIETKDYQNDEWTTTKASSYLLGLFSQCCDYAFVEEVIKYIGNNINSDDYNIKHAALYAFFSIIETKHKDKMIPLVINSLPIIFNQFKLENSPNHIKEISAELINKISEYYGYEIWKKQEIYEQMLTAIVELLTKSSKKVVVSLCKAIHFLIVSIVNEERQSSNIISQYTGNILNQLLTLAYVNGSYNPNDNVAENCFLAIGTVIEKSSKDIQLLINQFFKGIISAFENTLNPSQFPSNQMRYDYQQYITSVMVSCLISAHLEEEDIAKVFNLLIESFKERNCIYEEGILTISTISTAIQGRFYDNMKIFAPFLFIGLKSVNEVSLCRTSLHATCDLIGSLGEAMSNYVNDIFSIIISILSDNNIDRDLKLFSFNVISDMFCYIPKEAVNHFNTVMTLIGSAMQAARIISNSNDEIDTSRYALNLRDHLVESLSFIFTSISEVNKIDEFFPYVSPIIEFITIINTDNILPSDESLKHSIGLISDFTVSYGKKIKEMIEVNAVNEMMNKYSKFPNNASEEEKKLRDQLIQYAKKQIGYVLN